MSEEKKCKCMTCKYVRKDIDCKEYMGWLLESSEDADYKMHKLEEKYNSIISLIEKRIEELEESAFKGVEVRAFDKALSSELKSILKQIR